MGAATVTNGMGVPEKINTTTTRPSNGSTEYLENTKTLPQKDRCTPIFTAALFTITRHTNTDLGGLIPSNSDTERQIPDALVYIPRGKKYGTHRY